MCGWSTYNKIYWDFKKWNENSYEMSILILENFLFSENYLQSFPIKTYFVSFSLALIFWEYDNNFTFIKLHSEN